MIHRYYKNYPGSILRTSISRDCRCLMLKMKLFEEIRSSGSNGVDTIGKSAENYGDTCRVCFVSWISCGDIMDQRGSRNGWWRMGSWAIWRPLVTWRRMLRTIKVILDEFWEHHFFVIFMVMVQFLALRANHQDASRDFKHAFYAHSMIQRCYKSYPGSILRTSFFSW